MYTEFILIFVGLGILILLTIAILVLLIVLLRRGNDIPIQRANNYMQMQTMQATTTQTPVASGNIVFCKKCATEFDASQKHCPRCGTAR